MTEFSMAAAAGDLHFDVRRELPGVGLCLSHKDVEVQTLHTAAAGPTNATLRDMLSHTLVASLVSLRNR